MLLNKEGQILPVLMYIVHVVFAICVVIVLIKCLEQVDLRYLQMILLTLTVLVRGVSSPPPNTFRVKDLMRLLVENRSRLQMGRRIMQVLPSYHCIIRHLLTISTGFSNKQTVRHKTIHISLF